MKFYCFLFGLSALINPILGQGKRLTTCSEPANWKINFNSFELGNSQFDNLGNQFSRVQENNQGKLCTGLQWVNATPDNWNISHSDAVHLDSYCPDVICRCLNCGSHGLENQAFSGYVDSETGLCHVPWDGEKKVEQYQILTNPCGMKLEWKEAGTEQDKEVLPACSVVGGFEATAHKYVTRGFAPYGDHGSLSYVGRYKAADGNYYAGKVHAVDEKLYYPYKGWQKTSKAYQVLVLRY